MKNYFVLFVGLLFVGVTQAQLTKLIHPGVLFDQQDLDRMKSNYQAVSPWKEGYVALNSDPRASINYKMKGPFAEVGREPNLNLSPYENDAFAAFYQAIQWYLTRDENYARNAQSLLNSWAITHKIWSGGTPRLTAGPTAMYQAAAAEILRYSYSGWTQDNTDNMVRYFKKVVWPVIAGNESDWNEGETMNTANQSALMFRGILGIAFFCDDAAMANFAIEGYRHHPNGGVMYNTLFNGQISDFGRDQGHAGGQIGDHGLAAEMILKQGIDVWGDLDNRLLSCMEYYCKANLKVDYPGFYVWGPAYDVFNTPNQGGKNRNFNNLNFTLRKDFNLHNAMEIFEGAYNIWKGEKTPYIQMYRDSLNKTMNRNVESLLYHKDDNYHPVKAVKLVERLWLYPDKNLTEVNVTGIGSITVKSSAKLKEGIWTIESNGTSNDNEGSFAFCKMDGNGTIVARVLSMNDKNANQRAGIMVCSSTSPDSAFVALYMKPGNGGITFEGRQFNGGKVTTKVFRSACIAPYWMKIERRGDEFIAFTSPDGVTWAVSNFRFYSAFMSKVISAGMFYNSGSETVTDQASFDHVQVGIGGAVPVEKKYQSIDFIDHASGANFLLRDGIPNPIASCSSGLPLSYYIVDNSVLCVKDGKLKALKQGTTKIYVWQAGNEEYYATGRVDYTITITGDQQ